MSEYTPLLLYLTVSMFLPVLIMALHARAQRRYQRPEPEKEEPYESGFPTRPFHGRYPVKFYLVAMLFVIFDIEAASFYPWAVNLRELGAFGLWEMAAFVAVLAVGYAFVWKRGGFTWS